MDSDNIAAHFVAQQGVDGYGFLLTIKEEDDTTISTDRITDLEMVFRKWFNNQVVFRDTSGFQKVSESQIGYWFTADQLSSPGAFKFGVNYRVEGAQGRINFLMDVKPSYGFEG